MVSKKLYVHFEEHEPNFTSPFALESSLTFEELASQFCTKYNSKHGARRQLEPQCIRCKVGSKVMQPESMVVDSVNAGEDVFIVLNQDAGVSESCRNDSASSHSQIAPLEKKLKVYVHYEIAASSKDANATQVFQISDANITVGTLIKQFVEEYNRKRGGSGDPLDAMTLCARTDSEVVVGAYDKVASRFKNNDDIWLAPIDIAIKEDNSRVGVEPGSTANPIEASKRRAKDKSYYYWAKPMDTEAAAPKEAPRQIRVREAREEELVHFKTLTSYSFENTETFVKVYISLPDVGSLPKDKVQCDFDVLSFSLRIFDYQGSAFRALRAGSRAPASGDPCYYPQAPKLSSEILPEESSVKVLKDTIVVRLRKAKDGHHWFELHKTKGIGE